MFELPDEPPEEPPELPFEPPDVPDVGVVVGAVVVGAVVVGADVSPLLFSDSFDFDSNCEIKSLCASSGSFISDNLLLKYLHFA